MHFWVISLISHHCYSGASPAVEGGTNIYPIMATDEKEKESCWVSCFFLPPEETRSSIKAFIYLCGHICPVSSLVVVAAASVAAAEGIPSTDGRMKRHRLPDERLPIEALAESAMWQCDPLRNRCLWCWSKSSITGLGGRRWRLLMWSPSSSAVT